MLFLELSDRTINHILQYFSLRDIALFQIAACGPLNRKKLKRVFWFMKYNILCNLDYAKPGFVDWVVNNRIALDNVSFQFHNKATPYFIALGHEISSISIQSRESFQKFSENCMPHLYNIEHLSLQTFSTFCMSYTMVEFMEAFASLPLKSIQLQISLSMPLHVVLKTWPKVESIDITKMTIDLIQLAALGAQPQVKKLNIGRLPFQSLQYFPSLNELQVDFRFASDADILSIANYCVNVVKIEVTMTVKQSATIVNMLSQLKSLHSISVKCADYYERKEISFNTTHQLPIRHYSGVGIGYILASCPFLESIDSNGMIPNGIDVIAMRCTFIKKLSIVARQQSTPDGGAWSSSLNNLAKNCKLLQWCKLTNIPSPEVLYDFLQDGHNELISITINQSLEMSIPPKVVFFPIPLKSVPILPKLRFIYHDVELAETSYAVIRSCPGLIHLTQMGHPISIK